MSLTETVYIYIYIYNIYIYTFFRKKVEKFFLADALDSVSLPRCEVTKLRKVLKKLSSFICKIIRQSSFLFAGNK